MIASPGFTKDQFHRHLLLEAERRQLRPIIENKSPIVLVHTTSGYKCLDLSVMDEFVAIGLESLLRSYGFLLIQNV
nr:protein pelota 1 [Quercus suber]